MQYYIPLKYSEADTKTLVGKSEKVKAALAVIANAIFEQELREPIQSEFREAVALIIGDVRKTENAIKASTEGFKNAVDTVMATVRPMEKIGAVSGIGNMLGGFQVGTKYVIIGKDHVEAVEDPSAELGGNWVFPKNEESATVAAIHIFKELFERDKTLGTILPLIATTDTIKVGTNNQPLRGLLGSKNFPTATSDERLQTCSIA